MKHLLPILCLLVALVSNAQEGATFILVRHAEKGTDDPKDPNLTEVGIARSAELAGMLERTKLTAVYSTPYKRTMNTVQPIAKMNGLIVTEYAPNNPAAFAALLMAKHTEGTVLISGHSNTIPALANALLGVDTFTQFDDADHGNILVIFVDGSGKGRLLHLRF